MDLKTRPDFCEVRKRWRAFWLDENSRPIICIVIPKKEVEPVEKPPYLSGADGNFGPAIDQLLLWTETHDFIGDAIPFYHLEFGPAHFSALLGTDLKFNNSSFGTSWSQPFVANWDKTKIAFRRDSLWWKRTVNFARAIRKRCGDRLLIAPPALSANLDALAAIRGSENLLTDLIVCPDKIHRALDAVSEAYAEIMEALSEELEFDSYGSINRHGLYCEGKIDILQSDISCMISSEMFREFVIPYLERQCSILDAAEYHLDGPGAIKHLETICQIKRIDIIQWVPGAGEPFEKDWSELYRKIDSFGKGQILVTSPERARKLWEECKSRKIVFINDTFTSKKEAESFLKSWD
ncbi:MAG: hypothetical protein JW957_03080 [Candidatus Omnitrophica bacterium]|nr:hypothetical protein [Candidatus Omnitrophota bacterium]